MGLNKIKFEELLEKHQQLKVLQALKDGTGQGASNNPRADEVDKNVIEKIISEDVMRESIEV